MVTPRLGAKKSASLNDRSSGHHRVQILESHIEQPLSMGMGCLLEVWNAGESDGARTRGLLRAGQRCAENSNWPINRLSREVISIDPSQQALVYKPTLQPNDEKSVSRY